MYNSLTKSDWIAHLSLPEDYKVDAMLYYGWYNIPKYTKMFFDTLDKLNISYEKEELSYPFLYTISSLKIWNKRIRFSVNYGSTMISELVHIGCVLWSEKNILLWTCGWLGKNLQSWDIIIPPYTYGNESAIRMYNRTENYKQYSNIGLSGALKNRLLSQGIECFGGPLITCNGMLGETQEDIHWWSADGYYWVEMESATVFAVSNRFWVPASAMVFVSDNLIQNQLVGDETHKNQIGLRKEKHNLLMETAIKELLS